MSTTRKVLREKLGGQTAQYYSGAVTSGSQTTLVDNVGLKSSLLSSEHYVGQYLYRPDAAAAGDKTRRVYQYDPATGTLTPDVAWTNAAAVAEAYEIYRYMHPERELVDCIDFRYITDALTPEEALHILEANGSSYRLRESKRRLRRRGSQRPETEQAAPEEPGPDDPSKK